MDLRGPFDAVQRAFGLAATVTVPGASPVATTTVWLSGATEDVPHGTDLRRAEQKRLIAVPKADVPQLPRLTIITVPEFDGAAAVDWTVDSIDRVEFDHSRAYVVRA